MRGRDDAAPPGFEKSAYLEWGLAVVVLQFLISPPKKQHAGTAVLHRRKEKSVRKAVAQASSKDACSQGDLTRIQRNENARSTGGHFCSSEGPGGGVDGPWRLSAEAQLLQRLWTAAQQNLQKFKVHTSHGQ